MTGEVPAVSGLTVDDLNRLADDELADAIDMGDESWFWPVGGEKAEVIDGLRDLQATRAALMAVAREVEGLRAEVERLDDTVTRLDRAMDERIDEVVDLTAELRLARSRADTAERRLAAVHELHQPRTVTTGVAAINGQPVRTLSTKTTCAYCSERMVGGYEAVGWPCPTVAAAGPVLVTPPRELGMTADEAAERAAQQEANE